MNEHKPEPLEAIEKAYPEAYRLARRFHELYEEYAPQFGYKTREDTRAFDPTSPNGRTMARVAYEVVQEENTAKYHEGYKQGRFDQKMEGNTANAEAEGGSWKCYS